MKQMRGIVFVLVATAYWIGFGSFAAEAGQSQPAQKNCPVMGYPVNTEYHVEHEGKKVYFCCSVCNDEFKKDPAKYLKKLDG
jgi:YHS domain-containing protein